MRGMFAWYDLLTHDVEASFAFYTHVARLGRHRWNDAYDMITSAAGPIGGIEALDDDDAAPHWLSYVECGDIGATLDRVPGLGGAVVSGPTVIPDVGRMAVIRDPTGATIALFQSNDPAWSPNTDVVEGAVVWHECYAGDLETAWAFYSALFDWEVAGSMQLGAAGEYRMYRRAGGERALGGMMTRPAQLADPCWVYYFHVDDIATAAARVTDSGGRLIAGPMQIPGGEFTAICEDPAGAVFALHAKVNSAVA